MAKKQNRSESQAESLTVRMSPRTKYGLELLARAQRRTLASVAEWLFQEGLKAQHFTSSHGNRRPVEHVLDELWDPLEPDRFVKLAMRDQSLLSYDESLIWKVIDEEPSFWTRTSKSGARELAAAVEASLEGQPVSHPRAPNMKRIREHWDTIKAAAKSDSVSFAATAREG